MGFFEIGLFLFMGYICKFLFIFGIYQRQKNGEKPLKTSEIVKIYYEGIKSQILFAIFLGSIPTVILYAKSNCNIKDFFEALGNFLTNNVIVYYFEILYLIGLILLFVTYRRNNQAKSRIRTIIDLSSSSFKGLFQTTAGIFLVIPLISACSYEYSMDIVVLNVLAFGFGLLAFLPTLLAERIEGKFHKQAQSGNREIVIN